MENQYPASKGTSKLLLEKKATCSMTSDSVPKKSFKLDEGTHTTILKPEGVQM